VHSIVDIEQRGYSVSVSGGTPQELLPPDFSYTHSIPFGSFDNLSLKFTLNGVEIADSPVTVSVKPTTAIILGATITTCLLMLFVGIIVYKKISRLGFDASAEKVESVDAKLMKILTTKMRLQNMYMGIEVSTLSRSLHLCSSSCF
jgi:hypothetical protein